MEHIRLATEQDIPAIADTHTTLLTYEEEIGGHSNWKLNVYPTILVPQKKVPAREMYVLEDDNGICASMVLNKDQAGEYAGVDWLYPAEEA